MEQSTTGARKGSGLENLQIAISSYSPSKTDGLASRVQPEVWRLADPIKWTLPPLVWLRKEWNNGSLLVDIFWCHIALCFVVFISGFTQLRTCFRNKRNVMIWPLLPPWGMNQKAYGNTSFSKVKPMLAHVRPLWTDIQRLSMNCHSQWLCFTSMPWFILPLIARTEIRLIDVFSRHLTTILFQRGFEFHSQKSLKIINRLKKYIWM